MPKGENQVRLYHPYGVLFDEAAFLPEFMQAYSTVKPVTKKIWAISSAGVEPRARRSEAQTGQCS